MVAPRRPRSPISRKMSRSKATTDKKVDCNTTCKHWGKDSNQVQQHYKKDGWDLRNTTI